MRSLSLLATVHATFSLQGTTCNTDDNGWTNCDTSGGSVFSLALDTVDTLYTDASGAEHPAHPSTISGPTSDNRYVLQCPDTDAAHKTVKVTVTRPSSYTRFEAEAVYLYKKDSWDIIRYETEPYTQNQYGSRIPLNDVAMGGVFRNNPNNLDDTSDLESDTLNLFIAVEDEGDFEFKYGNPAIKSACPQTGCDEADETEAGGKWVALEFKNTLLRVGTPWANCGGTDSYTGVGSIIPLFLGNPNTNRALYDAATEKIKGVTFPVKVILPVLSDFGANTAWTNSELGKTATATATTDGYDKCYPNGNACPRDHAACTAEACNVQQWRQIANALRPTGTDNVEVLAEIDVLDAGGDLNAMIAAANVVVTDLDGFYFSGGVGSGADTPSTAVNVLDANLRAVSAAQKTAGKTTVIAIGAALHDSTAIDTVADVFVTQYGTDLGLWAPYAWYPYKATTKWAAMAIDHDGVLPIADTATTLFDRGYGWVYIHGCADVAGPDAEGKTQDGADGVFDSHDGCDFNRVSTHLETALARVATQSGRRLRGESSRRLQAAEPTHKWSCDDTLLECAPVCLKTVGVTTVKVAGSECEGAPLDACACPCLFDAAWTCPAEEPVCTATATATMEPSVVGDLVCSTRGTPKPEACSATSLPVARGSVPSATCAARHRQRIADAKAAAEAATATTEEPAEPEVEQKETLDLGLESAAPLLALSALAALFA